MSKLEKPLEVLYVDAADPLVIAQARLSVGATDAFERDISTPETAPPQIRAHEVVLSALSRIVRPLSTATENLRGFRRQHGVNKAFTEVYRPRYTELI